MNNPTVIETTKVCGTCKYRGEAIEGQINEDYDWGPTGYFLCTFIKHINRGSGPWLHGLGAGAKDGSGYHAALCVETDFGCNRWAPVDALIDCSLERK